MLYRKLAIILFFFVSCSSPDNTNPHIRIKTRYGAIEVELFPEKAPRSVATFLSNVDAGYYENSFFYRVLNDFNQPTNAPKASLIQGGLWKNKEMRSKALQGIPHESTQQTKILHKNGVISFARLEPGTAGTEFFICLGDQPGFDHGGENNPDGQGYAAFGKVVKGMDVVRRIFDQPEYDQAFDPPVYIFNISRN